MRGMDKHVTTVETSPWQRLKRHFSDAFSEQFEYRRGEAQAPGGGGPTHRRFRDAYRYILLLLTFVLVPMLAHDLYTGQWLLAVACLLLLGVIVANIWLLSRSRQAFLSPTLLLLSAILLALLSVIVGQRYSLFWLYPLLAGLPVLLSFRRSVQMGLLSAALTVPTVVALFPLSAAVVICVSLGLTWVVSAWLVFAVTEQSRRLRDMAITDPLTGAFNRRYLEEQAAQAMNAWRRYRHPATMLLLDIDHFKRINDKHGHTVGDLAIKRLVEVISGRIRSVDTLCRFGGEEFVILLTETGIDGARRIAQELRQRVEEARILPQGRMTISIGICEVMSADNLDHWFNLADTALYLAKRNGRNRVEQAAQVSEAREPVARTVPDWR
jgi:diguanylate cyclase (GGDEF)-like protein